MQSSQLGSFVKFDKVTTNYEFISTLGMGSDALVYLAVNKKTQDFVAIKEIIIEQEQQIEITILKSVNHPSIIRLLEYFFNEDKCYLVLEFCGLGNLGNFLRNYSPSGSIAEVDARPIILQLIDAIYYLHSKNIVHRDLKLANILLTNNFQIKICDFGISKIKKENPLTSFCGTPQMIAPEIFKNEGYNEKCDIWSLGIVIYQILFAKVPNFNNLQFENISEELQHMIQMMLQTHPDDRISSKQLLEHEWVIKNQQPLESILTSSAILIESQINEISFKYKTIQFNQIRISQDENEFKSIQQVAKVIYSSHRAYNECLLTLIEEYAIDDQKEEILNIVEQIRNQINGQKLFVFLNNKTVVIDLGKRLPFGGGNDNMLILAEKLNYEFQQEKIDQQPKVLVSQIIQLKECYLDLDQYQIDVPFVLQSVVTLQEEVDNLFNNKKEVFIDEQIKKELGQQWNQFFE